MADELSARTADGVTLRIDRVRAQGEPRGAVVCLHAMMTDGRYFGTRRPDGFAAALAARGLDVYVADFRGHGRSQPPRAGRDADWSFDDLVELDLPAIVAAAPPGAVLLGHSLGGLVACAALGTARIPPPRGLVLVTTSVWLGETLRRRALMAAYRRVTQVTGKAPIRALRIGPADESRTYIEQLAGWCRTGRWTSLRGLDYLAALSAIDVPTVALAGGGDWMCRPDDAARIAAHVPTCTPVEVFAGARHFDIFARDDVRDLLAITIRSRYSSS